MDELTYFDLIERYIDKDMSPEERTDFEAELLHNHLLAEEFDLYQQIISGIKDSQMDDFKKELREIDFGLDVKLIQAKSKKKLFYYTSIAASFLLFISFSIYVLIFNRTPNYKEIALLNRDTEIGLPVFMSMASEVNLSDAMNRFKQMKYAESLNLFKRLEKIKQKNDTIIYFIAVNYELMDSVNESIDYYKKLFSFDSSAFMAKAEYHLSLCYLLKGDVKQAKNILLSISNNKQHSFNANAIKVLEQLN